MKHILILSLGLLLLISCTQVEQPTTEESLDEQKEKLREYVRSQLNNTQNTSQQELNENITNQTPAEPEQNEEEPTPQNSTEEIEEDIDISITFVEFSGERNFDIDDEDDSITVIIGVNSTGIEKGENIIGRVSIFGSGNNVIESCLFLYIVGEEEELECELNSFEDYGTFDYQVFIDDNEKYTQEDVNLSNNLKRGEVEIES